MKGIMKLLIYKYICIHVDVYFISTACWSLFEISSRSRTYGCTVVYSIVAKPHPPVGERVLGEFFAGYLDIAARSPFPQRYSLRTNKNI